MSAQTVAEKISPQYIAGYIDGEGTIYAHHWGGRENPNFRVRIGNTHLKTLQLIRDFFDKGQITIMKDPPGSTKPYYEWRTGARMDTIYILEKIIPYLIEKKERATKVLEEAKSRSDMRYVGWRGCTMPGCKSRYFAKGFCDKHYHQERNKNGK